MMLLVSCLVGLHRTNPNSCPLQDCTACPKLYDIAGDGESEAIAKGSQNVVLGLGVLGVMMFASFVGDIFSIAKK